jgi:aldose 1-epimerase
VDEYVSNTSYFGAIIGRYANRIAGARFTLDGRTYQLSANDGPNHLHGGRVGFDRVVWRAEPFHAGQATGLELRYISRDGDEGYPGNLEVQVRYRLTDGNELGRVYRQRSGVCLETQHFPDSPNRPSFPSTLLRPNEQYRSQTVFAFGVAP